MQRMKNITRSWLPLACIITALCGLVYLVAQQALRQEANDPQIQMAEDAADILSAGGTVESLLPVGQIDMSRSIAPFVVVFDESGTPVASSALLHGEIPNLPAGVFDYVRKNGEDRITWQPEPNVRMAIVVVNTSGSQAGFIMAGRSLREVEIRVDQLSKITGIVWLLTILASLVLLVLGDLFLSPDKTRI
jgi:hypothetical protein